MHDGGEVILKYHHLNQMFYVLSKTISIPSTFLVWLNKPGVSRIVISRTPIFHFSRPLSILHAAIKQKSSNHTESPLPFHPIPPQPPPLTQKKEANSLSNCPTRTTFFFTLHGDSHHQGTQMAEMWHGPSTAACQRPLQHLAARARRQLLAVEATTWGCQVGSRLFFFSWEKLRENQLKVFCLLCFCCLLSKNVLYTNWF